MDIFGDFLFLGRVVDGLRRSDRLVKQSDGIKVKDGASEAMDRLNGV